jgi:hypothetical protein
MKEAKRNGESIIRQSQLERSVEIFTLLGIQPSLKGILRLSQILVEFQYDWDLQSADIEKFDTHYGLQKPSQIKSKEQTGKI